jgi:hypothetical protein
MSESTEPIAEVLAETRGFNYSVWKTQEPDGEITYQLQLNNITVHFFEEEWQELLQLIKLATK